CAQSQLPLHSFDTDLVQLIDGDEHASMFARMDLERFHQRGEKAAIVQSNDEIVEAKSVQHLAHRRQLFCLDDELSRTDGIDVALVELAEPPFRGPIGAPHRLNLIPLEI